MKSSAFLLVTINNSTRVITIYLKKARDRDSYIIRLTLNTNNINKIVLKFKLIVKILKQVALRDLHSIFD